MLLFVCVYGLYQFPSEVHVVLIYFSNVSFIFRIRILDLRQSVNSLKENNQIPSPFI